MWLRAAIGIVLLLAVGCAGPSTNIPKVSAAEIASEKVQQQIFQIQKEAADSAIGELYSVGNICQPSGPSFQSNSLEVVASISQYLQQSIGFARYLQLPDDLSS